jgi:uncharacterized protein YbjQ (UPF0145 family)
VPWFRRSSPVARGPAPDPERARRAVEAIEAGGLPPDALERLKAQTDSGGVFTSDLAVGEFAMAFRDGWRPRGLVMGSSVFRVNWQGVLSALQYGGGMTAWGSYAVPASGEIVELTQAVSACRHAALHRLDLEAAALGAHGVVGVRLRRSTWDWGAGLAEFAAVGTAVQLPGAAPLPRAFVGAVTAVEAHKLLACGVIPTAIVGGTSVYYVSGLEAAMAGLTYVNCSLDATSRALGEARRLAAQRMRAEAAHLGANGIVGVRLEMQSTELEMQEPERTDHILEVYAVGTAVVQTEPAAPGRSRAAGVRAAVDLAR